MTVKERLIDFAKSKERSVRAFERKTGLTIGYVNAIRVSIQPDKVQSIASVYPDLNTGWLLTGEGSMLKENKNEKPEQNQSGFDNISKALDIIQSQQEAIAKLSDAALIHARNIEKLIENKHQPGTNHDRIAG